ncbi:MAG: anhydro-N-acetylmuramic acid kinase [Bacteroidota bacterium]
MIIIGLMSGTSLDGLDIAACKFWLESNRWHYTILCAQTQPYTPHEAQQLKNAFYLSGMQLIAWHHQYGKIIGQHVKQFCEKNALTPDYISSHGHTIFHQPDSGFTFQLGHGADIAAVSGIKTICDFRTTDVAHGGQGAPLVPIGDELLFPEYTYCLNLGGISNISFQEGGIRKAFDIGICNMALNDLAQRMGMPYDKDGMLAQSGQVNADLLQKLYLVAREHHQHKQSLGYEWYTAHLKPLLDATQISVIDKLRTCCEFIAGQIAAEVNKQGKVLLTGGGARNKFLLHCIVEKTQTNIIVPDSNIIDFKEALIFAFLGLLRVKEQVNCLSSVTGANKNSTGGTIYLP